MNVQSIEDSNLKHVGMSYLSSLDYPKKNPSVYAGEWFKIHSYDEQNELFICEGYDEHFALTPHMCSSMREERDLPSLSDPILESALTSTHYLFFGLVFGLQIDDPPVQEVDMFIGKLLKNPSFLRQAGYKSLVAEYLSFGEYVAGLTKEEIYDKFYEFLTTLIPISDANRLAMYYTNLASPNYLLNSQFDKKSTLLDIATTSKVIDGKEVKYIVRLVEDHGNPDYPNTDELMTWMEIDGEVVEDIVSVFIKKGSIVS
ncbi:hypothetical protein C0431_12565 [bacterium]|nr:hypothetical protein [bacterium]